MSEQIRHKYDNVWYVLDTSDAHFNCTDCEFSIETRGTLNACVDAPNCMEGVYVVAEPLLQKLFEVEDEDDSR